MGCITSRSSEEGEMLSRRRAAVLDDDDLLSEILLRLPPQPSSLPRASLVCKRWRSLISDPGFSRLLRRHHRRNPSLFGFFDGYGLSFVPTLESPNCLPPARVSLKLDKGDGFMPLGYRHGLVLMLDHNRKQVLVWNPFTGDQHRIALPLGLNANTINNSSGAVIRASGDFQHFQVVLVVAEHNGGAVACVYSSQTGEWGNLISTPLKSGDWLFTKTPAVLVDGNSLYWLTVRVFSEILQFDLERQSLAVIPMPPDLHAMAPCDYTVTHAEGGGLGLLIVSNFCATLWKRKADCDGSVSWVLGRTIELDNLLSLKSGQKHFSIRGFAEDNNMVFLWSTVGIFMIHLDSLYFKKLSERIFFRRYYPFESVYLQVSRGTFGWLRCRELLGVGSSISVLDVEVD